MRICFSLGKNFFWLSTLERVQILFRGGGGGLTLIRNQHYSHTTCPHTTVASVALGDIHFHFAWQAWHLVTSTVTLRGRRGTDGTGLALVARLVPRWRRGRRGFLRGRRGTRRHGRASCVAGVGLGDIVTLRGRRGTDGTGLALVARLVPRWRRGRRGSLRGRRGTWRHRRASCVTGVGLGDIYLRFRWQAWHFWHFSHFWHWAGFSGTLVHTHLVHTQLVTTCPHNLSTHNLSTYICCTCQSFTISFLFPAFPIPSWPFFCQFLEEVDMWGFRSFYWTSSKSIKASGVFQVTGLQMDW